MKTFNRAVHQQIVRGHVIPQGAFYGKVTLKYEKRTPLEKRVVRDKDGNIIYAKDGTPKMRIKWRIEQCTDTLYYSVETLKKMSGNYIAYIAYENNDEKLHWSKRALGECVCTRELNNFIAKKIDEYLTANHTTWESLIIHVPHVNDFRGIGPKRKEVQKVYIYRGIPMRNPDDTDVKPRMPIIHTNMDKLHPIDDKPVYSSRIKSKPVEQYVKYTRTVITIDENGKSEKHISKIKDTVCSNPANSGYIRNSDGTVTTRDGKAVKTRI